MTEVGSIISFTGAEVQHDPVSGTQLMLSTRCPQKLCFIYNWSKHLQRHDFTLGCLFYYQKWELLKGRGLTTVSSCIQGSMEQWGHTSDVRKVNKIFNNYSEIFSSSPDRVLSVTNFPVGKFGHVLKCIWPRTHYYLIILMIVFKCFMALPPLWPCNLCLESWSHGAKQHGTSPLPKHIHADQAL